LADTVDPRPAPRPGPADERHAAFWRALQPNARRGVRPPEKRPPEKRPTEVLPTDILPPEARAALDKLIAEKLAAVHSRCASLGLSEELLLAHWARHLSPAADLEAQLERTRLEELVLAAACAEGLPSAQEELQTRVLPQVVPAVRRIDPSQAFVDEVRQHLLERLLVARPGKPARIAEFAGESSLVHWVRAVAVRLALNHRRDSGRSPELPAGDGLVEIAAPLRDPQFELLQHGYGQAFSEGLRDALGQLEQRARAVLRLHYVDGLSLAQVGAVYQVNKSTVSRWLGDAREQLLSRLRRDLEGRLGIAAAELDSVLRAIQSRVELSLASALRSRAE
jgi:RNA polymerase sigma-70 factor (ECF subfamily)